MCGYSPLSTLVLIRNSQRGFSSTECELFALSALTRMSELGRSLPVITTECAGQLNANGWSARMQLSGQWLCK
jgi:hypothetical protein